MTVREVAHSVTLHNLRPVGVINNTPTDAFDLGAPFPMPDGSSQVAQSASILLAFGPGNLASGVFFVPRLQESENGTTGWVNVAQTDQEWFQNSVPGRLTGGVWVPSIPGGGVAPSFNDEALASHLYMVSYVGGSKRYVRINPTVSGTPTNNLAVIGLLGSLQETWGALFTNHDAYELLPRP